MGRPKNPSSITLYNNHAASPKTLPNSLRKDVDLEVRPRTLVTFSNSDGSRHYLYSVGLFGGRAVHHLTLPGCSNDVPTTMPRPYFLSPVKGLVCFFNGKEVFVCNPSTKKVRNFPACPTNHMKTSLNSYLYRPYSSYSFGYDSFSNLFKILHVFGLISREDNKLYNVESRVLTIKTPGELNQDSFSWRKIASSFPYPYAFRTQGIYVNGIINWIGRKTLGEENIVCFDVKEEKYRLIPSPPNGVPSKSRLVRIGEELGIMSYKDYGDFSLELWVYTNSTWVQRDVGSYVALERKGMDANIATIVGNGTMLLTPDVLLHNFVLCSLNGVQKGMKIMGLPGWVDFLDYKKISFGVYDYVESVVPLDFVVRLGDFVVDLAVVRPPKEALLMELMPREEVDVSKVFKEHKGAALVFGDLDEFLLSQKPKKVVQIWVEKKKAKTVRK